jgi:hypothetical protein
MRRSGLHGEICGLDGFHVPTGAAEALEEDTPIVGICPHSVPRDR